MKKGIEKELPKIVVGGLILFVPLYVIHAQLANTAKITFSVDASGNWQYTSGFHDNSTYYQFITSDGRGGSGIGADTKDTSIPSNVKMEVIVADTHGGIFSSPCSSPHFTGNPSTDLACVTTASENQGYSYTIGQSWQDSIATVQQQATTEIAKTTPCKCP